MKYKNDTTGQSVKVTVVGESDLPVGLYDPSGAIRVVLSSPTNTLKGLYAPNGALYVTLDGTPPYGQFATDGSWLVNGSSGYPGVFDIYGGERITF